MTTAPTFDDVVASLTTTWPPLSPDEQRRAVTLRRTLVEGEPVPTAELARRLDLSPNRAAAFLDELPGAYGDEVLGGTATVTSEDARTGETIQFDIVDGHVATPDHPGTFVLALDTAIALADVRRRELLPYLDQAKR